MSTGTPDALRPKLESLQTRGLMVGGAGLVLTILGALAFPHQVLPAYLVAYLFFVGIGLGSTSFLLLHNLTGGAWGAAIRKPLEAGGMTLIPLAILFLPIVIGAGAIFPWVHPSEHMAELIANKRGYLSVGWFTARAVIYFTIWIGLAVLFDRLSTAEDRTDDPWPTIWMQRLSGPGLVLLFLTASFAAIDWGMSLEPEWYSTMFPPLMIVGWGLTTFAVMIIVVALLAPFEPVPEVVTPSRLNDLGNLMLTFVMLWAYMSFSQYLIIWAGQMLEEQPWYLRRTFGAWGRVGQVLILFHFIVPFVLLLFRESKRKRHFLMGIAALVALMHVVDLAWVVFPAQVEDPLATHFTWYSAVALPFAMLGVGGIWLACFLWFLKGIGLLPAHLPAGIETAADGTAPAIAPGGP